MGMCKSRLPVCMHACVCMGACLNVCLHVCVCVVSVSVSVSRHAHAIKYDTRTHIMRVHAWTKPLNPSPHSHTSTHPPTHQHTPTHPLTHLNTHCVRTKTWREADAEVHNRRPSRPTHSISTPTLNASSPPPLPPPSSAHTKNHTYLCRARRPTRPPSPPPKSSHAPAGRDTQAVSSQGTRAAPKNNKLYIINTLSLLEVVGR